MTNHHGIVPLRYALFATTLIASSAHSTRVIGQNDSNLHAATATPPWCLVLLDVAAIELVSQRTMTHPHQPVVNGLIYGDGDAPLHDVLLLMFTMHSATGNICSHRQMPDLYTPAGATSKAIRC